MEHIVCNKAFYILCEDGCYRAGYTTGALYSSISRVHCTLHRMHCWERSQSGISINPVGGCSKVSSGVARPELARYTKPLATLNTAHVELQWSHLPLKQLRGMLSLTAASYVLTQLFIIMYTCVHLQSLTIEKKSQKNSRKHMRHCQHS